MYKKKKRKDERNELGVFDESGTGMVCLFGDNDGSWGQRELNMEKE